MAFKWAKERTARLDFWDIGAIKWSSILLGMIVGAYIANFVKQYLWLFIVLTILIVIRPAYKFLKK